MKSKARMNLDPVVFVCYFLFTQSIALAVTELDPCTNTTTVDCCLCSQASCDMNCPPSLFRYITRIDVYQCNLTESDFEMTTTGLVTTTLKTVTSSSLMKNTTSDHNATGDLEITTESDLQHTTDSTHKSTAIIVCLTSCPDGYFHDSDRNCTKCDAACKTCNSSGSDGCLECKLMFNNTCYAECPENTVQKNLTCVDKKEHIKDDKNILPIIIGASAGGGVVVIIVVVVIVVCCCCRKRRGSGSEFSNLEGKKSNDPKERKQKGPAIPRRDYENTAPKDGTLKLEIPNQGDKVLRYTKDPTESVNVNIKKPTAQELKNRDSTYANASTIQRLKNMPSEEQEIDALPPAPMAPPGTPDIDKRRKHGKSKVPFKKRISQKFSSAKSKKKGKEKQPMDEVGENYIDMSHTTPVTERKSENQSTEKKSDDQSTKHTEEDYENAPKKVEKKPLKPGKPQTGVKFGKTQTGIKTGKTQTGIKSGKTQTCVEDELEDYENAPGKLETQSKVNPEEGGQEDYEVMNEVGQAEGEMGESATNIEDEMEDYENIKLKPLAKAGNSKKPVIPVGKTKELLKKFEQSKTENNLKDAESELEDYENYKPPNKGTESKTKTSETKKKKQVDKHSQSKPKVEEEDGLEDYENSAMLAKVEKTEQSDDSLAADMEEPYENVKMVKGKMTPKKP